MLVTCPICARQADRAWVAGATERVVCDCGHTFDPAERPTRADPFVGGTFAAYRFDEWIGAGAMGAVYRAHQLSLGRDVAVKVLPEELSQDPHFVRRFHREAQVLASLNHPHVVQVFDRGEIDGRLFLAMEFVDGRNLRDCCRDGGFEPPEAVRIVVALMGALAYAHERGIVHRDIKPENILISHDGIVKVADFGLSRVLSDDPLESRLTHTNVVMGTFEYMAPEQREGLATVDARADIYSAAVVLYELLTGELPIGRFAAPSAKTPELDRRIDAVIDRGLAKDPDDRYAGAAEMGRALETLLTTPDAPVMLPRVNLRTGEALAGGERQAMPASPSRFEVRLDLLFTILAGFGILITVAGAVLLFDPARVEIGLLDLDRDSAGLVLLAYGMLLWNTAERSRRHWPGARNLLLALTGVAAVTLIALPFTVWTWATLLSPAFRRYVDARFRGASEAEAAALAQGFAIERRGTQQALARRAAVVRANRIAATWMCSAAVGLFLAWLIAYADTPLRFKDEGAAVAALSMAFANFGFLYFALGRAVANNRWLRLNAAVWTVTGLVTGKTTRRARALRRDQKDGLL